MNISGLCGADEALFFNLLLSYLEHHIRQRLWVSLCEPCNEGVLSSPILSPTDAVVNCINKPIGYKTWGQMNTREEDEPRKNAASKVLITRVVFLVYVRVGGRQLELTDCYCMWVAWVYIFECNFSLTVGGTRAVVKDTCYTQTESSLQCTTLSIV